MGKFITLPHPLWCPGPQYLFMHVHVHVGGCLFANNYPQIVLCCLLIQTFFNDNSEIDWEIYYWIGKDTSVSSFHSFLHMTTFLSLSTLSLSSLSLTHVHSLPFSLPLSPFFSRWTRKLVLPCMLSICVTCWVLVGEPAGRSKGRSQMLSGRCLTPVSTTLKVSHQPSFASIVLF